MIKNGPKNIREITNKLKQYNTYIIFSEEHSTLLLKCFDPSEPIPIKTKSACDYVSSILSSEIGKIQTPTKLYIGIQSVISKYQNKTIFFYNKKLFANNYLETRLLDEKKEQIEKLLDKVKSKLNNNPKEILKGLGWNVTKDIQQYDNVSVVITDKDNFSIREKDQKVAPSDIAISELNNAPWAILTNGKRWRLYSNRVSANTTNYFELVLDDNEQKIKYLIALFGFDSYIDKAGQIDVDYFFNEGKKYVKKLEDNIADKIMKFDGLFVGIIKGALEFNNKTEYTKQNLEAAKQNALKILYRIWFLAYAEATNLLPIKDSEYAKISLQNIRTKLDSYNDEESTCWQDLLVLFRGVRGGSPNHNLPQYNGHLFEINPSIDDAEIKNKFLVPALTDLLKRDDEPIDYGSFNVRHLGHIFENLMEYNPKQAQYDLMLLVKNGKTIEVKTSKEVTYSIKKGDIYLASKEGIAVRKTTASYYTPEEIVTFLVDKGLTPIFTERETHIQNDINRYKKNKNEENAKACIDRLLDIQVLDPAMGSGHFLVEVLNRITKWVTDMRKKYPNQPLSDEIKRDRKTVLEEQKNKGIIIDENLLADEVLLKRKVMKRCIFGVDINPMAVDLAKLSLWLDSFAIGVPLTYMDHHIKIGDSAMGMFWKDVEDKKNTSLDEYDTDISNKLIHDVSMSSDMTITQVRKSEENHQEYQKLIELKKVSLDALTVSKIDPKFLPKKTNLQDMIHRFGKYSKSDPVELVKARKIVSDLSEQHKFFHWDLEMRDAFTNTRWGFDCIVGNPPWEKVKPSNKEFFTPIDPAFKDLTPNTKKKKRKEELLKNKKIKKEWEMYEKHINQKSKFYNSDVYKLQGKGDKDLYKLILERASNLVTENGIISIVIPSRILFNPGGIDIRKHMLEKNILSMYMFENRKNIFQNVDSRYRFLLLTLQNNTGKDKFPAGFYLHHLDSLKDHMKEQKKFGMLSKKSIKKSSPDEYIITEITDEKLKIFKKLSQSGLILDNLGDGCKIKLISGFHRTNDSDLFSEDEKDWPVFEGKNMHQYTHNWLKTSFNINKTNGLNRLQGVKAFLNKHEEIHNEYNLIFRNLTDPTNVRTCISTIIPPNTFYVNSLRSIVLTKNGKIILGSEYNKKIAYLCGVMNSLTFDFISGSNAQNNLASTIMTFSLPKPKHEKQISNLVAKLLVGTPEFAGFADSFHIPNDKLTIAERIKITAEIDALVADSYDLTVSEYETIIDTFNLFERNPDLHEMDIEINKKNEKHINEFYGEMADTALKLYKEMKSWPK